MCKYVHSKSSAWYVTENKEVSDRNIGVALVRKYANFRTLACSIIRPWAYTRRRARLN